MNKPEMQPVSSSQLKAIGYQPDDNRLFIEFHHGGSTYAYEHVTQGDYEALRDAQSIGKHFAAHLKAHPSKFPFKKL